MPRVYPLVACILLQCIYSASMVDNRRLIMRQVTCVKYNNIFRVFECDVQPASKPNTYLFNGRAILTQRFDKEFRVRLRLHVQRPNIQRELRIIDLYIDFCKQVDVLLQSIAFSAISRELIRASNFPVKCPVKENVVYRVNNFTGTTALFGTYSQDLNFTLILDFYNKRVPYGTQTNIGSFYGSKG